MLTLADFRDLGREIDKLDKERAHALAMLDCVEVELNRLGIPRGNTNGGSCTPYGRLAALKSITFEYQDNATPKP